MSQSDTAQVTFKGQSHISGINENLGEEALEVASAQAKWEIESGAGDKGKLRVVEKFEFPKQGGFQLRGGFLVCWNRGKKLCELAVQTIRGTMQGQGCQGRILGEWQWVPDIV